MESIRQCMNFLFCNFYRLLHVRTANCQFAAAKDSYEQAVELASQLESMSAGLHPVNWLSISLGYCQLLFAMNHYREVVCNNQIDKLKRNTIENSSLQQS